MTGQLVPQTARGIYKNSRTFKSSCEQKQLFKYCEVRAEEEPQVPESCVPGNNGKKRDRKALLRRAASASKLEESAGNLINLPLNCV